ncbi:MAG: hypothetical protein KKB25_02385 [Nanoarchaeota archaeon]|nr:hypothetical protein [Nanoarchaeota archaeon]
MPPKYETTTQIYEAVKKRIGKELKVMELPPDNCIISPPYDWMIPVVDFDIDREIDERLKRK